MQNNTTTKSLNQNKMIRTLISLALLIIGINIIIYAPTAFIYGIAGWQIGSWCNEIATKLTKTNDDVY